MRLGLRWNRYPSKYEQHQKKERKRMAAAKQEETEIDLDLVHETDKAFLVSDGDKEVWLPKALTTMTPAAPGKAPTFTLPVWLAAEKGLL